MLARKRKYQDVGVNVSPSYAILKLKSDTNCIQLLQYALSLGVADISFVSHPREYFNSMGWLSPSEKRTSCSPDDTMSQNGKTSPLLSITDSPPISASAEIPTLVRDELPNTNNSNSNSITTVSGSIHMLPMSNFAQTTTQSSSTEPENHPIASDLSSMITTLFGSKPESQLSKNNDENRSCSPTPVIPGSGQIVCKLCGIAVSCRKITNLSTHTLKLHCPTPLWKCPSEGCTFDHADHGRVRSHIRHQHIGMDLFPVDNRTSETVQNAEIFLKRCYPSVDFENNYKNIIYLTEPVTQLGSTGEKPKERVADPTSQWDQMNLEEKCPGTSIECSTCKISIPTCKKMVEEHIRINHKNDKLFICSLCEYVNADEWKVRVHATIKHPEKPLLTVTSTLQHTCRTQHLVRKHFPTISEKMPQDDIETLISSFNLASIVAASATPPTPDIVADSSIPQNAPDENAVVPTVNTKISTTTSPTLPLLENAELATVGDAAVQNILMQMFPNLMKDCANISYNPSNNNVSAILRKSSIVPMNRIERVVGKVECKMCSTSVETKRTMLVSHAKSHCTQRQWQCPHCETSAAFHSKLKLHIVNAHKSEAEPIDLYSPSLENKWLLLFRQCFPQFSQQCFVEEWKFRSKQQQHYATQMDEPLNRSVLEGCEQPRRSLLIEDDPPPLDELSIVNVPSTVYKSEIRQENI